MLREIDMSENSIQGRNKEKEPIATKTGMFTQEIGLMILNVVEGN